MVTKPKTPTKKTTATPTAATYQKHVDRLDVYVKEMGPSVMKPDHVPFAQKDLHDLRNLLSAPRPDLDAVSRNDKGLWTNLFVDWYGTREKALFDGDPIAQATVRQTLERRSAAASKDIADLITTEEVTFLSRFALERIFLKDPNLLQQLAPNQQKLINKKRRVFPSQYDGNWRTWKGIEDKAFENRAAALPPPPVLTQQSPTMAIPPILTTPEAQSRKGMGPLLKGLLTGAGIAALATGAYIAGHELLGHRVETVRPIIHATLPARAPLPPPIPTNAPHSQLRAPAPPVTMTQPPMAVNVTPPQPVSMQQSTVVLPPVTAQLPVMAEPAPVVVAPVVVSYPDSVMSLVGPRVVRGIDYWRTGEFRGRADSYRAVPAPHLELRNAVPNNYRPGNIGPVSHPTYTFHSGSSGPVGHAGAGGPGHAGHRGGR